MFLNALEPYKNFSILRLLHAISLISTISLCSDDASLWSDHLFDMNVGTIQLPTGVAMKPCNNLIVKSMPGNFSGVLEIGKEFVSILQNDNGQLEPFSGRWKWEPDRAIHEPLRKFDVNDKPLHECSTMTIFGDEKHNYDEAKRFCFFGNRSLTNDMEKARRRTRRKLRGNGSNAYVKLSDGDDKMERMLAESNEGRGIAAPCTAYSIGSNNKWDFEVNFFKQTNCRIETFDCTCNATVPKEIEERTRFWGTCIGTTDSDDKKFLTFPSLNKMIGRKEGPDYLKVDIEGYEWGVLKSMADQAMSDTSYHKHLPLQIYGEFHLDREATIDNVYKHLDVHTAYVGKKLRHFFDELFIKAGYLVMHRRVTLQTRNSDILLVKLFCPAQEDEALKESQT